MRPAATPHADPADARAFQAAREICRRQGGDFYFASAFLPRRKRDAAHAVYAFCRMIAEVIDLPDGADRATASSAATLRDRPLIAIQGPAMAMEGGLLAGSSSACCSSNPLDQRMQLLRERLDELYTQGLELPSPAARSDQQHVFHAFTLAARRFQIPRQLFLDIAEGCRADVLVRRYATWASLERHLRRSAGAMAAALGCVFGLTNSGAAEHAVQLGTAIALTGILRDVKHDPSRGRVYLPLEDLARFRYSERDLAAGTLNDNFRQLMHFEISRARRLYREAAAGLCWVAGDGSRLAAATMTALSTGVLDTIERQGYDLFARRPQLSFSQKLRQLPLAWRLARRRNDTSLPSGLDLNDAAPWAATR